MNKVKLDDLIKDNNIVIPLYMFRLHKKFKLNLDEFAFLMYLHNRNFTTFDPDLIALELNYDIMEVMGYISVLADKDLISLDIDKEKGIIEERISLNNFHEKVRLAMMEELVAEESVNDSIYSEIEREFNRKLTPMECELVREWQKNGYSDELIHEALKEASLNGVANLRYIDTILMEWEKKGIKKKEDIKKQPVEPPIEIYNCNWLEDEDEI